MAGQWFNYWFKVTARVFLIGLFFKCYTNTVIPILLNKALQLNEAFFRQQIPYHNQSLPVDCYNFNVFFRICIHL